MLSFNGTMDSAKLRVVSAQESCMSFFEAAFHLAFSFEPLSYPLKPSAVHSEIPIANSRGGTHLDRPVLPI